MFPPYGPDSLQRIYDQRISLGLEGRGSRRYRRRPQIQYLPDTEYRSVGKPESQTKQRLLIFNHTHMHKMFHACLVFGLLVLAFGCKRDIPNPALTSPSGVSGFAVNNNNVVLSASNDSATVATF